ncbi:DUF4259 domain-containing protein [Uliginosibacterium sp. 31-12]|uniref:DUF4259 domain-containing protein n=1 Tax=Uliginosibacterium sp. 31-12 TaxID=3062781 RepID=UPI0026E33CD6|nr:DUF4259 domain-containing protein [Uliginosibacterium sp. 31-12]MDO6388457.1 DUF4259 domain-containing protein [Uliginosibacterium sp. 31-12]
MNRRNFVALAALSAFMPFAKAGAWDSGSFDNDDALDWAGQCIKSKGSSLLSATLNAALVDGYLEAPECSAAVAAAEVVAASKGKASKSLPKELSSWLEKQHKEEIARLSPVATKAVSRILNGHKSELQELWQENKKDFPVWKIQMQSLIARLK